MKSSQKHRDKLNLEETPEQREARLAKNCVKDKARKAKKKETETPAEKSERRAKVCARLKEWRDNRTSVLSKKCNPTSQMPFPDFTTSTYKHEREIKADLFISSWFTLMPFGLLSELPT